LPLNFVLEYAIRRVQVKDLKLNGKYQLQFYVVLSGNLHIIEKKAHTVVVFSKEIGIKADKPKYMVMSRDQNAGRSHNVKLVIAPLKDWKISNIW